MPKVLIADEISKEGIAILKTDLEVAYEPDISAEELLKKIADYDALLVRSRTKVTKEVLKQGKNLKVVGRAGVGVDNIDLEAATEAGVLVINSPEGNTASAAEHTLAIMLSLARQIPSADSSVKSGKWERSSFMGSELFNKTLGLIGLGKVGGRVAQYALSLGMKVLVHDPLISAEKAEELHLHKASLDEIWSKADFITVHTPKTRETANMINKEVLSKLKPGVKIVNTSRGGIIDEKALAEAIKSGHVSGAALDVFDQEPPGADFQLNKLGNQVVLTPHLGASTVEAQHNVAIDLAEQLRDFLLTGMAKSPVNLPFMRPELLKGLGRYLWLAEAMGAIAAQLNSGNIDKVEIAVAGGLTSRDTQPLVVAALKGVFTHQVEGVTYVNAQLVARNHGIEVCVSMHEARQYPDELTVVISSNGNKSAVTGTILAHGEPIITLINDYPISLSPARYMLFTSHRDQPGMVAKVAGILGENQINISTMAVARRGVRDEAVMVMTLDDPLDAPLIGKFTAVTGINRACFVSLHHLK